MEFVIIYTNDYFPSYPTPLYNLNEGFLEYIDYGKILMYQVYK